MKALISVDGIVENTTFFQAGKIPEGFKKKGWKEYTGDVFVGDIDNGDGTYSRPVKPLPSDAELIETAKGWLNAELVMATEQIHKKQDGMTIVGTIVDWRAYRVALRNWPQDPNFPDDSSRPVAPS